MGDFDESFIKQHTLGYERIGKTIDGCTPAWTESITGVSEQDIRRAAEHYGAGPSVLWAGQGLQRQNKGGNIMRSIGLLPALTGNIGKPGAGISYLNVAPVAAGLDFDWLEGANLKPDSSKTISHMEFAKRLENEAKMDSKFNDFSYFFEKGENAPDPLFSHMKRGSGMSKTPKNLNKNRRKIDA